MSCCSYKMERREQFKYLRFLSVENSSCLQSTNNWK